MANDEWSTGPDAYNTNTNNAISLAGGGPARPSKRNNQEMAGDVC